MSTSPHTRAGFGIAFVLAGIFAMSVNDMLIKQLSGGYPLHQIVFLRSIIALAFSLVLVRMEGGMDILRTSRPFLHTLRCLLIVAANMSYFAALAALPLADATALFYVAPLMITLLSIPLLGEKVGPMRLGAVLVGFAGVVIMQRPWADADTLQAPRLVLLLPVISALSYALNQIMTRRLGVDTKASALSVYIQVTFVLVSLAFYLVAGDGRYADAGDNPSVDFLLRAWVWPASGDWWVLTGIGANAAVIGYCLSQAYRLSNAATIAPFEYAGLPLAILWGWVAFGDLPLWEVWVGILLIVASGLFVFLREHRRATVVARGPIRRR